MVDYLFDFDFRAFSELSRDDQKALLRRNTPLYLQLQIASSLLCPDQQTGSPDPQTGSLINSARFESVKKFFSPETDMESFARVNLLKTLFFTNLLLLA